MLNPELKLNPKIFNEDVERGSARQGFGEGLLLAGKADDRVVALCADLTESVKMHFFKKEFPERFFEVGVAEQNLVTVASGLAASGKLPFVGSYAMFSPGRNWEQIRTTIAYNDRRVVVVGSHAGVSVGPDGGTHQALEDMALMRVIPNMEVYSPCDYLEAKKLTVSLASLGISSTPAYLRLSRSNTPNITTEETPFELYKSRVFWIPDVGLPDVCILVTGPLVYEALLAAKDLEKEGVKMKVINVTSVKPLDEELVLKVSKEAKALVTVEEHQIVGGLGGAVSEFLVKNFPIPIEFVGVHDAFGQSGTPEELKKYYKLDKDSIKEAVKKVISRK